MDRSPGQVTVLLRRMKNGNKDAEGELLPLLYRDLRRIAGHYMCGERVGHTLQPTALINEAYLRLVEQNRIVWKDRSHFLGVAAQLMRRILVDHARQRAASKRGGHRIKIHIGNLDLAQVSEQPELVLAVHEALTRLGKFDAQQGRIAEMRYFAGLTVEETAETMGLSPRTVKREWAMALAWLKAELAGGHASNDG